MIPIQDAPVVLSLGGQVLVLLILAIPVACISWTVTHEEILREPREWCVRKSRVCRTLVQRKFFYLFTCEYCFSHYVSAATVAVTGFTLIYTDWKGYLVGGLALVWVANVYMSLFGRLRLEIRAERQEIDLETAAGPKKSEPPARRKA